MLFTFLREKCDSAVSRDSLLLSSFPKKLFLGVRCFTRHLPFRRSQGVGFFAGRVVKRITTTYICPVVKYRCAPFSPPCRKNLTHWTKAYLSLRSCLSRFSLHTALVLLCLLGAKEQTSFKVAVFLWRRCTATFRHLSSRKLRVTPKRERFTRLFLIWFFLSFLSIFFESALPLCFLFFFLLCLPRHSDSSPQCRSAVRSLYRASVILLCSGSPFSPRLFPCSLFSIVQSFRRLDPPRPPCLCRCVLPPEVPIHLTESSPTEYTHTHTKKSDRISFPLCNQLGVRFLVALEFQRKPSFLFSCPSSRVVVFLFN